MDYNFLIQEFLDGELDTAQEQELFAALSSDSSLRKELKQAIEMDKGLSKRVSAFVPTSSATMSIFSRLGIGTAAGVAAAGTALGLKDTIMAFFTTHLGAVVSAVVAIAVTAGSFLAFYNPPDANSPVAGKNVQSQQVNSTNNQTPNLNNQIPSVVSASTDNKNQVRIDTVIRYVTRTVHVNNDNTGTIPDIDTRQQERIEPAENETDLSLFEDITESKPVINNANAFNSNERTLIEPVNSEQYSPFPVNVRSSEKLNLSFEIKGNGYWNIPKADVPLYNAPAFANMQLSVLYDFSDKFSAGIDVRQESYYQKFTGTNEIGEMFEYKQYPNYYTFSAIARYSFYKNNMFGVFSQGSLGGTATGGVGRLMFGLEISPYSNLSFLLGLEGSVLVYQHQNNIFTSPKLGLNYGVAFNF